MSRTDNIAVVRRLYESAGSPEVVAELMAPDIVVDITPGYPNGGIYEGFENLMRDFFGPMFELFDWMFAEADTVVADDDNQVVVFGHYRGMTKGGVPVASRFAHLWTVENGRLVRQYQTADTAVLARALETGLDGGA